MYNFSNKAKRNCSNNTEQHSQEGSKRYCTKITKGSAKSGGEGGNAKNISNS